MARIMTGKVQAQFVKEKKTLGAKTVHKKRSRKGKGWSHTKAHK